MRVIAGLLKSRKLETIDTNYIRPTSDRVKEAMFSIIGDLVVYCRFLDLFAGSGSIGIEAYSRGAAEVVFIDSCPDSVKVLKRNLLKTGLVDKVEIEVHNTDYSNAINKLKRRGKIFDIIFIDPPYNKNIPLEAVEKISENNILSKEGTIIVEHEIRDPMPEKISSYKLHKKKKYGNTQLSFYVVNEDYREE